MVAINPDIQSKIDANFLCHAFEMSSNPLSSSVVRLLVSHVACKCFANEPIDVMLAELIHRFIVEFIEKYVFQSEPTFEISISLQ